MFEILFLLLPVAALYGYYMGRASTRSRRQNQKAIKNTNYLRGVEYLLNDNRDKAVDNFIAYLDDNDQSYESALALGNLFRRRGEFDKAINLHEKLVAERNLDESEHELAQQELARDFIRAGLLDRAEEILTRLVEIPRQRSTAAMLLLKVYEREQDYDRAIAVGLKYREAMGSSADLQLGQYYCQKARKLSLDGETEQAVAAYRYALDIFKSSLRARLELADLLIREKQFNEAYAYVKDASEVAPQAGLLCLEYLQRCFPNKADPNYRFALENLIHRTHSASAMVELVQITENVSGIGDAEAMLLTYLREKPNLKLFSALMGLRARGNNAVATDAIMQLKSIVDAQVAANARFSCHNCGFESKIMFWQCPSCRRWESMKTKVGLDGD